MKMRQVFFLKCSILTFLAACANKEINEATRTPSHYKAQNVNGVWLGPNAQVTTSNTDGVLRGGNQTLSKIVREEFANNSWGLLFNFNGRLYVQRQKVCTLDDGRTGKCPTSSRCVITKANNIDLCKADVTPREVEEHFDRMNQLPDNDFFQFILSN